MALKGHSLKSLGEDLIAHEQGRNHPDATEGAKGFTRYATQAETNAGADDASAVTPKKLTARLIDIGLSAIGCSIIGSPIDWPSALMPQNIWSACGMIFVTCDGQPFNTTVYPELAKLFPSGKVPDLRGEFIRGWDGGRGVDAGRALLSNQGDMLGAHSHLSRVGVNTDASQNLIGTLFNDALAVKSSTQTTQYGQGTTHVLASGGAETRPRNVAFNKIMRAG